MNEWNFCPLHTNHRGNNKGADRSARMPRLVGVFVVHATKSGLLVIESCFEPNHPGFTRHTSAERAESVIQKAKFLEIELSVFLTDLFYQKSPILIFFLI